MDFLNFPGEIKMELMVFDSVLVRADKTVIKFIDFVYRNVIENKAETEIKEAWKQLYLWASNINDGLCEDCKGALMLSTAEEAEELLGQVRARTTGNEDVIWAARLLAESFQFWGITRSNKPPKAPESSLECSEGIASLKEIHAYAVANNFSADIQKSWHQLYLWACSPKRGLSSDLAQEINLSTPEEAIALFEKTVSLTKGDAKVEEAIYFLDHYDAWARPITCEACRIRESAE